MILEKGKGEKGRRKGKERREGEKDYSIRKSNAPSSLDQICEFMLRGWFGIGTQTADSETRIYNDKPDAAACARMRSIWEEPAPVIYLTLLYKRSMSDHECRHLPNASTRSLPVALGTPC